MIEIIDSVDENEQQPSIMVPVDDLDSGFNS